MAAGQAELQQAFTQGLLQAGRLWRRAADGVARKHGVSDATALPLVLIARADGSLRQTALAEAMGVEDPSLVRLLDQLGAAGLVVRREDPADRRAKVLSLTAAGRAVASRIEGELSALRETIFAAVEPADVLASLRLFRALTDHARPASDAGAAA